MANFGKYSNKYLGYNRISEDIAIAALKSDAHYRNICLLYTSFHELLAAVVALVQINGADEGFECIAVHVAVVG